MLDRKTRKMAYVRAGHNPPVIVNRARNPQVEKLECPGTILGMAAGAIFDRATESEEFQLQKGDHFILYTDGIEEAKNEQGEMFGLNRIIEVTQREFGKELGFTLGAMSYELDSFTDGIPLEDDVTIIGVRIS